MSNNKIVHNLDEKQNPPEIIILGGVEMDISFIPCGVAIPLTQAYDEWTEHIKISGGKEGIENSTENAHKAAMLMAKVLSIFTKFHNESLDEEWILKHVSMQNLGFAITRIIRAISGNVTIQNKDVVEEDSKKKEQSNGNEQ